MDRQAYRVILVEPHHLELRKQWFREDDVSPKIMDRDKVGDMWDISGKEERGRYEKSEVWEWQKYLEKKKRKKRLAHAGLYRPY